MRFAPPYLYTFGFALLLIAAAFVAAALPSPDSTPELLAIHHAQVQKIKVIGITGAVLVGTGLALQVFYSRRH